MLRTLVTTAAVAYFLVGGSNSMSAQEIAPRPDYDARALRLESSGGMRTIVRGREGVVLGRIGSLRAPDMAAMVAPSAVAVSEAKEFKSRYDRGQIALLPGIVVAVAAFYLKPDDAGTGSLAPAYTAAAVSGVLLVYGSAQLGKAYTALGRAIWWYNRDLGR